MSFLEPLWLLLLLLPLLLIGAAVLVRARQREAWKLFVSDRLAPRLVKQERSYPWWLSFLLVVLGTLFLLLALARPVLGEKTVTQRSEGRSIFLAIDLSRSMLVSDVSPDRLTAAKTAALEVIDQFGNDRIGLISFAGKAWLEAPLTVDHNALRETVLAMNEKNVPLGGSNNAAPLALATAEQGENSLRESILLVLSDGEFHNRFSVSDIEEAVDAGIRVFTLGFGTKEGGLVPDSRQLSGRLLDANRRPVVSMLQEEPLRRLAALGQGSYFQGNDYRFLSELARALREMQAQGNSEQSFTIYQHVYHWFMIPGMLCLLSALLINAFWRVPAVVAPAAAVAVMGVLVFSGQEASAVSTLREAENLLQSEQFPEAAALLEELAPSEKGEKSRKLHFSLGNAYYRTNEFPAAIRAFSDSLLSEEKSLQEEAHYNLGNSLYYNGESRLQKLGEVRKPEDQLKLRAGVINEWYGALDHYHGALHLDRENQRARENYDIVKKKLEELEKQQEQQQQELQQMQEEGEPQEGGGSGGEGSGQSDENQTSEELERGREEERQREGAAEDRGSEEEPGGNDEGGEEEEGEAPGGPEEGSDGESGASTPSAQEARRILEENADFEKGNLRTGRRIFEREPLKDW